MTQSDITLNQPGSCFLDACALSMGVPAKIVQAFIRHHFPDADCDNKGYHPTYVNIALLELYKIGLSQIDPRPVDYSGGELTPRFTDSEVADRVTSYFRRQNFRCVVTGPLKDGSDEHANAWIGNAWVDPRQPTIGLAEPNVNIRSIWLNTLPPSNEPDTASSEEAGSDD